MNGVVKTGRFESILKEDCKSDQCLAFLRGEMEVQARVEPHLRLGVTRGKSTRGWGERHHLLGEDAEPVE